MITTTQLNSITPNSIDTMRSHDALVSGETSKVSNAGAASIKRALFPQQRLDHLRSSARPALILDETSRRIGTLLLLLTGVFLRSDGRYTNR